MKRRFNEYGLFFREYLRHFRTTGAVLPSGRRLARALSRYVPEGRRPKHVLEVGPGTGAVTARIIACLGPEDRLDLVELNDRFVERLRHRLDHDPAFQPAAARTRIFHGPVQDLPCRPTYDAIISGLPLNNFTPGEVEEILSILRLLLKEGGTLSFFEYIAVRHARALLALPRSRERCRGVHRTLKKVLDENEFQRDWVWPNVPPAWVHHVRFG